MNGYVLSAAGLSFLIALIHTFAGSRTDVAPLLRSDMPEPAKSTLFYCWHLVTIVLFVMTALFFWSGMVPEETTPVYIALILSVAFSVWGFAIVKLRGRSPLLELPQGLMFLSLTAVGGWGVFMA